MSKIPSQATNRSTFNNWRILLGIGILTTLGLLPFSYYHLAQANWILAGTIGGLNVLLAGGSLWMHLKRDNPAQVRYVGHSLLGLANVVAILSIYVQGGHTAYWVYPIIFANFYLLPLAAGTALSFAFVLLSLLAASQSLPAEFLARLLVTVPLCLFFGIVFSLGMTRQRQQLQYLADHDALTGAGSRHALNRGLTDAMARKKRYDERCALVIFDIDKFKAINDSMGHLHADGVIADLAQLVADRVRIVDRLYRFGGEEFVLLLPHTDESLGWQLAEALRMEVDEHEFVHGTRITISAGVAELAEGEHGEAWLRRADDALMRAKKAGRNRVLTALPADESNAGTSNATAGNPRSGSGTGDQPAVAGRPKAAT